MTGVELIAAERERQITDEGWTPEHDDKHVRQELADAAACYAAPTFTGYSGFKVPEYWPWEEFWWKPRFNYLTGPESEKTAEERKGRIRDLVRAGALIAAEIDRLQRKENKNV